MLSYSGVSALDARGGPSFGPTSRSGVVVSSTADGVDTRIDLTAGTIFQSVAIQATSAAANSRLTILGGASGMYTSIDSSSSPVTYQPNPGSSADSFYVKAKGMTAGTAITLNGGDRGASSSLRIYADGLPITAANFQVHTDAVYFSPPPPQGGTLQFVNLAHVYVDGLAQPSTVVESKTLDAVAGQALGNVVVATITTALPHPTPADFQPTIIWGDGTRADGGVVVADPNDPTRFYVMGSHTFAQSGSFTPGVTVQTQGRTTTVAVGRVWVQFSSSGGYDFSDNAIAIEGGLQRGQGPTNSVINDNEPYMAGQITAAQGRADRRLRDARRRCADRDRPERLRPVRVLGASTRRSAARRSIHDPGAGVQRRRPHRQRRSTTLQTGLVIDTVGPRVVGVQFLPGQGRVVVAYRDYGGVDNAGTGVVAYPDTYAFSQLKNPLRGYHPPAVDDHPGRRPTRAGGPANAPRFRSTEAGRSGAGPTCSPCRRWWESTTAPATGFRVTPPSASRPSTAGSGRPRPSKPPPSLRLGRRAGPHYGPPARSERPRRAPDRRASGIGRAFKSTVNRARIVGPSPSWSPRRPEGRLLDRRGLEWRVHVFASRLFYSDVLCRLSRPRRAGRPSRSVTSCGFPRRRRITSKSRRACRPRAGPRSS